MYVSLSLSLLFSLLSSNYLVLVSYLSIALSFLSNFLIMLRCHSLSIVYYVFLLLSQHFNSDSSLSSVSLSGFSNFFSGNSLLISYLSLILFSILSHSDLDEKLQKEFYEFLDRRGIKPSMTEFLQDFMIKKEEREYVTWLRNMKEFVEK